MATPDLPDDAIIAIAEAIKLIERWMDEPGRSESDQLDGTIVVLDLISIVNPDAVKQALLPHVPQAVDRMLELSPDDGRRYFDRLTPEQQAAVLERMINRKGDE